MKNIFLFFLVIISLNCSNNDDDVKNYKSEAIIVGFDWTLCLCCGGYIIVIEDVNYRLMGEFPPNNDLDLENLPLKVKLDWELKSPNCGNFITISAIEEID